MNENGDGNRPPVQTAVSPAVLLWVVVLMVLFVCLTIYGVTALIVDGGSC